MSRSAEVLRRFAAGEDPVPIAVALSTEGPTTSERWVASVIRAEMRRLERILGPLLVEGTCPCTRGAVLVAGERGRA